MTHVMVSLDLHANIVHQRAPTELMWQFRKAELPTKDRYYKIHRDHGFPQHNFEAVLVLLQKSVPPGGRSIIMVDGKLHDIPETVADAVRIQRDQGVALSTVHASCGDSVFAHLAAKDLCSYVVAVTALTSMTAADVKEVYGTDRKRVCQKLALIAARHGVDKFVCGVEDVELVRLAVRKYCTPKFYTPGIRPKWYVKDTDQVAVATPTEAKRADIDTIIIGRPILEHADPGEALRLVYAELDE